MASGDSFANQGGEPSELNQQEQDAEQTGAEATPPDTSEIERIVGESLSGEPNLPPDELSSLREVARRHRGRPMELRPVAIDLVEGILRIRFAKQKLSDVNRASMSEEIAATLVETPGTFERLEDFWEQLCESTL